MSSSTLFRNARASKVLTLAVLLGAAPGGALAAGGPFSTLAGPWSGSGNIALSNGARERIRCRSMYSPDAAGMNLNVELRCASDSFKFDLMSSVSANGGQVSGSWRESTRGVVGTISGTISGDSLRVQVKGLSLPAQMSVRTQGDQQAIAIQGLGSEMSAVAITLKRSAR